MSKTESLPLKKDIVSIDFFSKPLNKTVKLIGNRDQLNSLETQNRWYAFELEQPVYLSSINVEGTSLKQWTDAVFEFQRISGDISTLKLKSDGEEWHANIGFFTKNFRFKPPKHYGTESQINSVTVIGYPKNSFEQIEKAINNHDQTRLDLDEKRQELQAMEIKIHRAVKIETDKLTELKSDLAELSSRRGEAEAALTELTKKVESLETTHTDRSAALSDANQKLEILRKTYRLEMKELDNTERELREVKDELRLFPSEISGFVKESGRSIKNYIWLGAPFCLILLALTIKLLSGALDLALNPALEREIWELFLMRIPFVIVSLAIIQACAAILKLLGENIVQINQQRLSLAKIGVIAKRRINSFSQQSYSERHRAL